MTIRKMEILLAIVIVAVVAAVIIFQTTVCPTILRAHTRFLFQQLDEAYRSSITPAQQRVLSSQEFLDRIPQWTIDWNSCVFRNRTIYDSWGTSLEIHADTSSIDLRSAGPDRSFNTSDDVSWRIPNRTGAQQ